MSCLGAPSALAQAYAAAEAHPERLVCDRYGAAGKSFAFAPANDRAGDPCEEVDDSSRACAGHYRTARQLALVLAARAQARELVRSGEDLRMEPEATRILGAHQRFPCAGAIGNPGPTRPVPSVAPSIPELEERLAGFLPRRRRMDLERDLAKARQREAVRAELVKEAP